ncbi:MAG: hypothetical protein R2824_06725 [Saprospiraceae bacterium]
MNRIYLLVVLLGLSFGACKKEVDQDEVDRLKIEEYLADNNLSAEMDPSGLYYIIEEQGTGTQPNPSSRVRVRYKGYLLDGTVFDQNHWRQNCCL